MIEQREVIVEEVLIDAINRVADAIEEHHKVQSKIIHVLGFKIEDLTTAVKEITTSIEGLKT